MVNGRMKDCGRVMLIEKATANDIDEIEKMYYAVTEYLENTINYPAWINGLYPTRETFEEAVSKENMYVARKSAGTLDEGSKIVAGMVLKSEEEPEFSGIEWQIEAEASETYALCTLAVSADFTGCGIGEAMVRFAIELAEKNGKKAIRLDVTEINAAAIALYEKLGFKYIDTMDAGVEYEREYGQRIFRLYEKLVQAELHI